MDAYRIVIISRKRSRNMRVMRALLPTATVTVEESEMHEYAPHVPAHLLVPHPKLPGVTFLRNWVMDHFTEPCIVQCDDDLTHVKILGGACRTLRRACDILRVIENGVQVATDLDIGVFNWTCVLMAGRSYQAHDPFSFTKDCAGIFGIRGTARHRRFDELTPSWEDIDFSLQAIRDDRILLTEMRYHFDFGPMRQSAGGNLSAASETQRMQGASYLRAKWGAMMPLLQSGATVQAVRQRIPRRQP